MLTYIAGDTSAIDLYIVLLYFGSLSLPTQEPKTD
jgi:hypothetical protein